MSQRLWSIVPQSPAVAVAMWISQPASPRRFIVPAQRISASSGWARKLKETFRGGALAIDEEYQRLVKKCQWCGIVASREQSCTRTVSPAHRRKAGKTGVEDPRHPPARRRRFRGGLRGPVTLRRQQHR